MAFKPLEPPPERDPVQEKAAAGWRFSNSWRTWLNQLSALVFGTYRGTVIFNPASVAANTTAEQTVAVPGLTTDMIVSVNKPTLTAGLGIAGARVSAVDVLAITFINATAAPIDAGSETYLVFGARQ